MNFIGGPFTNANTKAPEKPIIAPINFAIPSTFLMQMLSYLLQIQNN